MNTIKHLLEESAARHSHLCPRQVLGVRLGLAGGALLGLDLPRTDKRMLAILETDGCFVDGIRAATGLDPGRRTMRIEDYGKVAAVFADMKTGQTLRLVPRLDVRTRAPEYVPGEPRHYFAQLQAYQVMPDEELFSIQEVILTPSLDEIISRSGVRVNCVI
jgi:formylmethanofuran dehydrogenase subunit E